MTDVIAITVPGKSTGRRYYKIMVNGETAKRMLETIDIPGLADNTISVVGFVVAVDGNAYMRDEALREGETPTITDEFAYYVSVIMEDEGTFPEIRAREVTNTAWSME